MTGLGLTDLPNELLALIFTFVPNTQLYKLKDIPELRGPALQSMYTNIVITEVINSSGIVKKFMYRPGIIDMRHESMYGVIKDNCVEVQDVLHLEKLVKEIPEARIKRILLKLREMLHRLLALKLQIIEYGNVRLSVTLKDSDFNYLEGLSEKKLEEFTKNIHSVKGLTRMSPNILKVIANCDSIVGTLSSVERATFHDHDFPRLRKLELTKYSNSLTLDELKLIPSQLLKFCGRIKIPPNNEDKTNIKLCLPPNLQWLSIVFERAAPRLLLDRSASFEHLQHLQYIKVRNALALSCIFPQSIREIDSDARTVLQDLRLNCPKIRKLDLSPVTSQMIVKEDLIFSDRIEDLSLSNKYFRDQDSTSINIDEFKRRKILEPKVMFGESIKLLKIGTCNDRLVPVSLNFNSMKLPKLEYFEGRALSSLNFIGNIPRSLKKVTLTIEKYDCKILQQLDVVEELEFANCFALENENKFDVSNNLKVLSIISCGLSKINVTGGRLKKLDISKNNITIIDQDTLIVPSGLEELIMYGNRVTEIKPNVKWPSNLQILDLNQNILEQANNFPYTLKKLSLYCNYIQDSFDWSLFPEELEYLNLARNNLKSNKLHSLNFQNFRRLREIDLSDNLLISIKPTIFPSGNLEFLNLRHNRIKKITGNFKGFEKLKEIDLRDNKLEPKFRIRSNLERLKHPITDIFI